MTELSGNRPSTNWSFQEIRNPGCTACDLCQYSPPHKVCLPGQGPRNAKWLFIGEAPGQREMEVERPFSGPVGQYFDKILENVGIDRNEVYITNSVLCHPPEDAKPTPEQLAACKGYLLKQIQIVRPEKILLIGDAAIQQILDKGKISDLRGKMKKVDIEGLDYQPEVHCIYHPGFIKRNPRYYPVEYTDLLRFKGDPYDNSIQVHYEPIDTMDKFHSLIREMSQSPEISFDTETEGLDAWRDNTKLVCLGITNKERYGYSIPIEGNEVFTPPWSGLELGYIKRALSVLLTDARIFKIAFNSKFDLQWLEKHGIPAICDYDPMVAATLLDENLSHSLESSVQFYVDPHYSKPEEGAESLSTWSWKDIWPYNSSDVDFTLRLAHVLIPKMRSYPRLEHLHYDLAMPAQTIALKKMEQDGIYVLMDKAAEARDKSKLESGKAEVEIRKCVPEGWVPPVKSKKALRNGFNPGSPKQLADVLFNVLGLPIISYTDKNQPSTAESVLVELKGQHPIMEHIMTWRQYDKYISTYLDRWMSTDRDRDGFIHPHYHMRPVTGRLSSTDPNLQQVPRDLLIRNCLGAPPGYTLLSFDYSQIEIRLVAWSSGDPVLIQAYVRGEDLHLLTASIITGIPMEELKSRIDSGDKEAKEIRKKAKAVNFGLIYGMGADGLVEYAKTKYEVDLTYEEAVKWRDAFFKRYPKLLEWHDKVRRFVHEHGYVDSFIGRRRHLADIYSSDDEVVAEAERQAINSPIQGLASDITLMSAIRICNILPKEEGWLCGLVHDSAEFIIKNEFVPKWEKEIKVIMENPEFDRFLEEDSGEMKTGCPVPIVVDLVKGQSWS